MKWIAIASSLELWGLDVNLPRIQALPFLFSCFCPESSIRKSWGGGAPTQFLLLQKLLENKSLTRADFIH